MLLLLIRAARQPVFPADSSQEPLILTFLHMGTRSIAQAPPRPAPPGPRMVKPQAPSEAMPPPPVPAPARPSAPPIDWAREAELAARNGVADAEKQESYRDLSALSAEQLSWIRRNHMQPAPPGIAWTHPRFEFDAHSGLPVIWVNDHCVLVMLMVFCGIGHIEADGGLFKHMGDAHGP